MATAFDATRAAEDADEGAEQPKFQKIGISGRYDGRRAAGIATKGTHMGGAKSLIQNK